jgi:hypothetical protein
VEPVIVIHPEEVVHWLEVMTTNDLEPSVPVWVIEVTFTPPVSVYSFGPEKELSPTREGAVLLILRISWSRYSFASWEPMSVRS